MKRIDWDWLYPEVRINAGHVIDDMAEEGFVVFAYSGFRSWDEQEKIYAIGRTDESKAAGEKIVTNAKPGNSLHNYGLAIDLAFSKSGTNPWSESHPWDLLGEKVRDHDLQWGGDWTRFQDRPHIYRDYGFTIPALKVLYARDKLTTVWTEIDKKRGVIPGLDWYGPQLRN